MTNAPFTVMDASAGSGKTRNLVKAVLTALLNQKPVRSILAITFTNAAAAEMKERLLEQLKNFAEPSTQKDSLFDEICLENNLTATQVSERSINILRHILHRYNDLSFGTIDSFTARLVRTFAKDLAMSENFEILLDTQEMLQQTTDLVLSAAGADELLTPMLIQFVEQKLNDEKSWSIDGALFNLAKKILEEKHREPLEKLRNIDSTEILNIRKKLYAQIEQAQSAIKAKGEAGIALMESQGIKLDSLAHGDRGIGKFFYYLRDGSLDKTVAFNKNVEKTFESGKWHSGKAKFDQIARIDAIKSELETLALEGNQLSAEHAPFILLSKKIIENLYAFATLQHLYNTLVFLQEQNNAVPLATFNGIVHQKLKDEPTAYIFERLGERYKHFFVDEFQDTSRLQWSNLQPLIENSLAEGGTALIVGDAKQSIYRWRNGDAEQFIELSERADAGLFNASVGGYMHRLKQNWRSRAVVVDFNNALFTAIAENIPGESYKNLYKNAAQKAARGGGGLVEIRQMDEDGFELAVIKQLIIDIDRAKAAGYAYKDIALLVRTKKSGAKLVQELSTSGYPVISSDSLFVGNSYEGRLLSSLTILQNFPSDKRYRWQLVDAILQLNLVQTTSAFQFAEQLISVASPKLITTINTFFPGYADVCRAGLDFYSFARELCRLANLDTANNAFVQAYLQTVQTYVAQQEGIAFDFLEWWQSKGCTTPIQASANIDALQVLTIHKSKGLQYPVVIIPFVSWRILDNKREDWVALEDARFGNLSEFLVRIGSHAETIGGAYQEKFEQLQEQEFFDSLNMLYVACTRAIDQLHLYGKNSIKTNDEIIFRLIKNYLETNQNHKIDDTFYQWGEETVVTEIKKLTPTEKLINHPNSGWHNKLQLATYAPKTWQAQERTAREWGNLVHFALAQITDRHSVNAVLHALGQNGDISANEIEIIREKIMALLAHPGLSVYFDEGLTVYNERDIVLPKEGNKRVDRLVKTANGQWLLLDYKTGDPHDKHLHQLQEYSALLAVAGIQVAKATVVYLGDEIGVVAA